MNKEDKIFKIRHSLAHLLAMAVLDFDPKVKVTIGPVIDNGFYYDFDFSDGKTPTEKDLKTFQKTIKKLINKKLDFERKEVSEKEAREIFKDNPYKLELIDEIVNDGQKISIYSTGDFVDLCSGPHIENTKEIDAEAFEINKMAGAYWRGDEKNKMLTRIYGLAFENAAALEEHKKKMAEAAERDHRKISKEMNLYTFSELVGAGLPLFTPKGTAIRNALKNRLFEISARYDMQEVTIPHLAKKKLYEISGHAAKFSDELIKVVSHYDEFVLKPVNCPHHTQIYASIPRSYRDLPVRLMESTMQYRDEMPGEISGLTRVRSITCDDGHIFCTPEQVKNEVKSIAKIIEEFYTDIGLFGSHWVSLSTSDKKHPEKYIGDPETWKKSEQILKEISEELNLGAKTMEGEAALYGPKIDYMFKDSLGREWQLATIQLDFNMPKRFGLEYTDKDGQKKPPVMIHRAILGSYERFLAILIEHFAGNFPFWIAPVQVKILPVGETHNEKALELLAEFKKRKIRAEIDDSNDGFGKKVRKAKIEKVPYFVVIGDKEIAEDKFTLESRDKGNIGMLDLEKLVEDLK
ncbi:MAG TPA: threonine--tRNA ligase [Candidatus Paceibacterota bacterium]|nr:threonine--tRNA ligase [Candidatus Paceibacterota bacterium]HRZ34495.1 threonine--tRNA ligase [Candidatus Paceibacterota bacterium]